MISVVLASFLVLLDNSIVSTAIPQITDEFHSLADVGWYGSAYTLGNAALQLVSGKTFQFFNLKWSWLFFFALFELGSALCGAAKSSKMLIVGRAIAGAGSSGVISGAFTIISACVPVEKRPPLIGALMGITQLGNIAGPVIGGAFTTGYTWRWCFYINLPVGALVAFPILFLHIPEQVPKDNAWNVLRQLHRHLDLFGLVLFAPALTQLLLALQYGDELAWNSPRVIGLFSGAGANFIIWLVWNYYKKDDALLPVSLVKRRTIWSGALFHGLLISTLFGVTYWLPIYFQAIKDMNAVISGVNLLPLILPQLVTGIACGFLVNRLGFIPPFGAVAGALISVATGLFSTLHPDTSTARRIGYEVIMGIGLGCGVQMALVNTQNSVSPQQISIATALIFWAQSLGPTIFLPLYNTIFRTSLTSELAKQAPQVDAQAVVDAGVTAFRRVVEPRYLPNVLKAYSDSIDRIFYLATSAGALAVFVVWGMGWKDIRKTKAKGNAPSPYMSSEHELVDMP
ncbi:major facilitator superfamily domain-containing protein [Xylaria grammica]|nr:major facilitator superfamily domain-containing protein [Xylaria grammica]